MSSLSPSKNSSRFCVVGSINVDVVMEAERFPRPGETLKASNFEMFNGGKGGNQAVALARLGSHITLVGKTGQDSFGTRCSENFRKEGVRCKKTVRADSGASTGIAMIEVETASGQNHILISAGANHLVTPSYVQECESAITKSDFLLLQLEIPVDSCLEAARIFKNNPQETKKVLIFDPAPAMTNLPDKLFRLVDYCTPNETEFLTLTGEERLPEEPEEIKKTAEKLLDKGVANVILKVGSKGAYLINKEEIIFAPGVPVDTVNTTAAGDAFNGALAVALAHPEISRKQALHFANAAGALATTKQGAQESMPTRQEVTDLLTKKH